jgi:hypothetical protein
MAILPQMDMETLHIGKSNRGKLHMNTGTLISQTKTGLRNTLPVKKIAAKRSDQYLMRMPPGLRKKIQLRADINGRSLNTEIICAIYEHMERFNRLDDLEDRIQKIENVLTVDEILRRKKC